MDSTVITACVAATASVFVALATFYLNKKKEREAEWRKQKTEHYREFFESLNGIVENGAEIPAENHVRWSQACNTIGLVAPQSVLEALWNFQDEISRSNKNSSAENHDKQLNNLLIEIRKDLGISPKDCPQNFRFRLWVSKQLNSSS